MELKEYLSGGLTPYRIWFPSTYLVRFPPFSSSQHRILPAFAQPTRGDAIQKCPIRSQTASSYFNQDPDLLQRPPYTDTYISPSYTVRPTSTLPIKAVPSQSHVMDDYNFAPLPAATRALLNFKASLTPRSIMTSSDPPGTIKPMTPREMASMRAPWPVLVRPSLFPPELVSHAVLTRRGFFYCMKNTARAPSGGQGQDEGTKRREK